MDLFLRIVLPNIDSQHVRGYFTYACIRCVDKEEVATPQFKAKRYRQPK